MNNSQNHHGEPTLQLLPAYLVPSDQFNNTKTNGHNGSSCESEKQAHQTHSHQTYYESASTDTNQAPISGRPSKAELIRFLRDLLCPRGLCFNELYQRVELQGQPLNLEGIDWQLAEWYDIEVSSSKATEAIFNLAKEARYHPVQEYLEEVADRVPPIDITNLASRYFETEDSLYDQFLYRMLIGAVARVFQPGCKFDNCLVLQGQQGIGKSSFFQSPCWRLVRRFHGQRYP